jgi:beta-lactam-binding protein with PASTA domain
VYEYPWLYRYADLYGQVEVIPWRAPFSDDAYRHASWEPWRESLVTVTTSPGWWDRVMPVKDLASDVATGVQHAMSPDWTDKLKVALDGYKAVGDVERLGSLQSDQRKSGDFVISWPNPFYDHVVVSFRARSTDDPFIPPTVAPAPPEVRLQAGTDVLGPLQPPASRLPISLYTHLNTERGDTNFWPIVGDDGLTGGLKSEHIEHSWVHTYVVDLRALFGDGDELYRSPVRLPFFYYVSEDTRDRQITHVLNLCVRRQELPPVTVRERLEYWRRADNELGAVLVKGTTLWSGAHPADAPGVAVDAAAEPTEVTLWRGSDGRHYVGGEPYDWVTLIADVDSDRPVAAHPLTPTLEITGGPVNAASARGSFTEGRTAGVQRPFVFPAGPEGGRRHEYLADGSTRATYRLDVAGLSAGYEDSVLFHVALSGQVTKTISLWTRRLRVRECDAATGTVIVPNVSGLPRGEALQKLVASNLRTLEQTVGEGTTTPPGHVASQEPVGGVRVAEGASVTIRVATATDSNFVVVPELRKLTLEEAEAALAKMGLFARVDPEARGYAPPRHVVGQTPSAGARVPPRSTVALEILREARPGGTVRVPHLGKLTEGEAMKALVDAGLVGRALRTLDAKGGAAVVVSQDPAGGVEVPHGSTVSFVLRSVGTPPVPAPVEVPNVVGQETGRASELLRKHGLEPLLPALLGLGFVVTGQEPKAGTQVLPGSSVTLRVGPRKEGPKVASGVTVPRVVGMTVEQASAALKAAGLAPQASTKSSWLKVARQVPSDGTSVPPGSVVVLLTVE